MHLAPTSQVFLVLYIWEDFTTSECLDKSVKEKKNLQFGIRLENTLAKTIKSLSRQSKLSMGEIVRLCVDRQLKDNAGLLALTKEKKTLQLGVKFEEHAVLALKKTSNQIGLPMAELIRLCVFKQLKQIRREGGIKLKLDPDAG